MDEIFPDLSILFSVDTSEASTINPILFGIMDAIVTTGLGENLDPLVI